MGKLGRCQQRAYDTLAGIYDMSIPELREAALCIARGDDETESTESIKQRYRCGQHPCVCGSPDCEAQYAD
jgi:hypothetical protein